MSESGVVILSINAGSSSLKTTVFIEQKGANGERDLRRLASAEISNINSPPAKLKYTRGSQKDNSEVGNIKDHRGAFEHVLNAFIEDKEVPEVSSKDDIDYTAHRVVQGGDFEEK
jgi:acetate kinase